MAMSGDCNTPIESLVFDEHNNEKTKQFIDVKTETISDSNNFAKKNSTNRNKRVLCLLCGKWMRNDHLKRHAKTHTDLAALDDQELRVELQKRKHVEDEREKNFQRIKNKKIVLKENVSPSTYKKLYTIPNQSIINDHDDEFLALNKLYLQKIEMGRRAHEALVRKFVTLFPRNSTHSFMH